MNFLKLFIVATTTLIIHNAASAQFIYKNYTDGIMSKKLFIFTELPDSRKSIIKSKEEKNKKDSPDDYEFWNSYLADHWHLTDDYKVLPFEDAYALAKKNKKNTYLVQIGHLESSAAGSLYTLMRVMSPTSKRGQSAFSVILNVRNYVSYEDIVYGLMVMQETLANKNRYSTKYTPKSAVKHHGKMLKQKTLYLGDHLPAKTLKKIKKEYPYPYKVVSAEEIKNAIIEKKEGVMVIRQFKVSSLVGTPKSNFIAYSTSDGAIVSHAIAKNTAAALKGFIKKAR